MFWEYSDCFLNLGVSSMIHHRFQAAYIILESAAHFLGVESSIHVFCGLLCLRFWIFPATDSLLVSECKLVQIWTRPSTFPMDVLAVGWFLLSRPAGFIYNVLWSSYGLLSGCWFGGLLMWKSMSHLANWRMLSCRSHYCCSYSGH